MKKKINSTLLILFFLLMCRDSAAQKTNDQDLVDFIAVANEVSNQNKAWNEADETAKNTSGQFMPKEVELAFMHPPC